MCLFVLYMCLRYCMCEYAREHVYLNDMYIREWTCVRICVCSCVRAGILLKLITTRVCVHACVRTYVRSSFCLE